jgi:regulator of replication initiation timing
VEEALLALRREVESIRQNAVALEDGEQLRLRLATFEDRIKETLRHQTTETQQIKERAEAERAATAATVKAAAQAAVKPRQRQLLQMKEPESMRHRFIAGTLRFRIQKSNRLFNCDPTPAICFIGKEILGFFSSCVVRPPYRDQTVHAYSRRFTFRCQVRSKQQWSCIYTLWSVET